MNQPRVILSTGLVAVVILSTTVMSSQSDDRKPEPEWQKSVGSMRALLVITDEVEEHGKGWARPLKVVPMRPVASAATGTPLLGFVAFAGCSPDHDGLCDVAMDSRVQFPDGNVVALGPAMEVWVGKPPPGQGLIELGVTAVDLVFEPGDPIGDYTLIVRVRDFNADILLELRTVIRHTGDGP